MMTRWCTFKESHQLFGTLPACPSSFLRISWDWLLSDSNGQIRCLAAAALAGPVDARDIKMGELNIFRRMMNSLLATNV